MRPILCNYYITYRCNAKCTFCDIWKIQKSLDLHDASLTDVEANLTQLKKIGVKFVDFTGGEPLLHENLPQMLAIAKQLKLLTSVTTNCLIYPERASEIKGLVDFLHFSLDSFDPSLNRNLRGADTHSFVMKSIDIAHEIDERPDILFTATQKNYKSISKLYDLCKVNRLMLIVNPVFQYSDQQRLSSDIIDYLNRFRFKPYIYVNMALHKLITKNGNATRHPRCKAMTSSLVISPENTLMLPCFHHRLIEIPLSISPLSDVLKSDQYLMFQNYEGRLEFCEHCTINCYFDPSFTYKFDTYFVLSLLSKVKYIFDKKIYTRLRPY